MLLEMRKAEDAMGSHLASPPPPSRPFNVFFIFFLAENLYDSGKCCQSNIFLIALPIFYVPCRERPGCSHCTVQNKATTAQTLFKCTAHLENNFYKENIIICRKNIS
jgi:hypothetical protein